MLELLKLGEIWKEFLAMPKKWKGIIISLLVLIIALVGLVGLQGCQSPSKSYVEANYRMGKLIHEDLKAYIEKDSTLSDVSRRARMKALDDFWELNQKAYIDAFGEEPKD